MRKTALILGILLATGVPAAQAQQSFSFFASIVDQHSAPVTTLKAADIAVREGGSDAKVTKLEPVDWPTKVQILIDNGTGVGGENLQFLRTGVRGLIQALPADTEVTLVSTAPQPRTIVKPTSDRDMLLQGVDRITPDSGGARFSEGLMEALDRVDKDKTKEKAEYFPVIVIVGSTGAEGSTVMDRDFQKLLQRIQKHAATVHVVMLTSVGQSQSSNGGELQTQVGTSAAKQSGGRYEAIAAPSRIATLLPEIGQQIATSAARQAHEYRVTIERPAGKSGQVGQIEVGVPAGMQAALSIDGHLP
ncbi:MAG TPA: VWA domain-containing protein [Vicinamibacterales bacterium]|nr:VWA domain-containing protein [Vicinamibacterales bacterium]